MEYPILKDEAFSPSQPAEPQSDLVTLLSQKIVGQIGCHEIIVPSVYMYQSGLAPAERTAGVFLLPGPTGTGRTRTVEAIAELPNFDQDAPSRLPKSVWLMKFRTMCACGNAAAPAGRAAVRSCDNRRLTRGNRS